jgi:hypothetical protein
MNPFEVIGIGLCAGFGFLAGMIAFCWIAEAVMYWWER